MRVIHLLYQAQVYEAQLSTNSKTDQADQITEMAEQMPCSSTGRKNLPTPGDEDQPHSNQERGFFIGVIGSSFKLA